jgi:transcriptional regulator with XRE-family HTH domain
MLSLKELRESRFLSQADLAQKAGVSKDNQPPSRLSVSWLRHWE